jgi:hypothetical protein
MVLFKNVESKSSSSLNTIKIETKKKGVETYETPFTVDDCTTDVKLLIVIVASKPIE